MDFDMPRVTVIMRTKDRPLLLARALNDVISQQYSDWGLIVVNDGGSPAPVDKLISKLPPSFHSRISVAHHAQSLGMEAASNRALAETSSEFVCVHDDDDTWDPRFLAQTVQHLDEHPDEAAVVVRTEIIYELLEGELVRETSRAPFWPDLSAISLVDLLRVNRFVPISLLYRRAVHESIGKFREDLAVVGDWEFHLRLAQRFRVGLLNETLAYWHQRPGQEGVLGNSVITAAREHDRADLLVRDEALKAHVERHGMGDLLYLTRYMQGEFDRLGDRLAHVEGLLNDIERFGDERTSRVEAAVREIGLIALMRRKYHAARARVRSDRSPRKRSE